MFCFHLLSTLPPCWLTPTPTFLCLEFTFGLPYFSGFLAEILSGHILQQVVALMGIPAMCVQSLSSHPLFLIAKMCS